jgi:nicotinate-nucleotide adenylyltransferase
LTLTRIGIYGGTFNPIHVGHLRAAEEVAELLDLARVLFVPSAVPPHKPPDPADVIAPGALRLEWVRLATGDNPRFGVDPLEVQRGGASYLVDTLRALRERLAAEGAEPVFLVGHDAFAEMGAWRAPRELVALAHWAVIVRPPVRSGRLDAWLPDAVRDDVEIAPDGRSGQHRRAGTWLRLVEIGGLSVSASDVRTRLREGRSVRYLLPEAVRRSVVASGAYCPGGGPEDADAAASGPVDQDPANREPGEHRAAGADRAPDAPDGERTPQAGGRPGVLASR